MASAAASPGVFDDPATTARTAPFTPFVDRSELRVGGKVQGAASPAPGSATGPTGRSSSRTPSFSYDELVTRARQTAFLVPGPDASPCATSAGCRARRASTARTRRSSVHEGGIAEFVEFLATDAPVTDVWRLQGTGHFTETVPVLDERGHMTPTEVERECDVDVALRWGTGYDTEVRTFVNIIATPKGGTHLAGFEQGLLKTFSKQVDDNARRLKATSRTTGSRRTTSSRG